jgi:hypothetical protein
MGDNYRFIRSFRWAPICRYDKCHCAKCRGVKTPILKLTESKSRRGEDVGHRRVDRRVVAFVRTELGPMLQNFIRL